MNIRLEEEKDYKEVENITREAFWNKYRPGCFEHLVIHNMRNDDSFIKELDYVIEVDNKLIGNIVYAKSTLRYDDGTQRDTLIFGPVSILPEYQSLGYGKSLIEFTMNKAKELGYKEILITGNNNYYKKYGFVSASLHQIYYEGIPRNDEAPFFMIYKFSDYEDKPCTYSDPQCYNIDERELEEFDKQFPKKTKEKLEGQLE